MAKLGSYFEGHDGTLKIYWGPGPIGTGSFDSFSDFYAKFTGSYEIFGNPGALTISIRLTDGNPSESSGPCEITLNDKTDNAARYHVNGSKMTCDTALSNTPIDIYGKQGGTQIDGVSGHNIWIGHWD
jgi:hypothetical protein